MPERDPNRFPNSSSGSTLQDPPVIPDSRRVLFPWAALVVLMSISLLEWYALTAASRSVSTAREGLVFGGLLVLHAVIAVILTAAALTSSLPTTWAWRGAFLCSSGLAVLAASLTSAPGSLAGLLLNVLAGVLGAFLGAIILTSFRMGLWEDNFPPSPDITQKVLLKHQQEIGRPLPAVFGKRAFDIILSGLGLILSFPVDLVIAFLIWLEDPGPILFVKNSVGKGGKNFHQYKFRTMVRDAEKVSGPVLANGESDERVLRTGRFLRKTALDELPQLFNILVGEMSFVGPRPQRTVLVAGYLDDIPGYAQRHRVAPGLAGLAQVAGSYYISPQEKLQWDQIYIQKISLSFDIKLTLLAFAIVFYYRWQKDWDEHLPDRWLKIQREPLGR
ncbi:MAG TPA: sugar transferase [Anaerolineaceae bacterium]|nr:sugar transferase [Anaerolineaceae bacterium]